MVSYANYYDIELGTEKYDMIAEEERERNDARRGRACARSLPGGNRLESRRDSVSDEAWHDGKRVESAGAKTAIRTTHHL